MNRGLLIVLSTLLIGNLGMYFYQNPIAESDDEYTAQRNLPTIRSVPVKSPGLLDSITSINKDKGIQYKPINHLTQPIIKEKNSRNYAWNSQSSDTGEIIDPGDKLMMENLSRHNDGQRAQDTGELIDPDDQFMIQNALGYSGEQNVQDTGEFIDPDE